MYTVMPGELENCLRFRAFAYGTRSAQLVRIRQKLIMAAHRVVDMLAYFARLGSRT